MARRPKTPPIPEAALEVLRKTLRSFDDPELWAGTRGRFCYVAHGEEPLCRLGYRPDDDQWDFALYRYSTGKYSNTGSLLPNRAPLRECIATALNAYNLT